MNAIEVLRQMHVEAKSAFQQIEQASPDQRGGLWAKLRPELVLHEQVEERFVYDPVKNDVGSRDPMLADWDRQHHQQVQEAETMIHRIGDVDPRESQWLQLVGQLRTTLEQHIQMEEGQIWPRIEQVWDRDKLDRAGSQIEAAKAAGTVGATVSGAMGQAGEAMRNVVDPTGTREHPAA